MSVVDSERLCVKDLDSVGIAAWDSFVKRCPSATFCHLAGWRRVIEHSFGHRAYYRCVVRGESIEGVLPLVHIKHPLFGNFLSSTSFCMYGGPVVTTESAKIALDASALDLAARLGVKYVEYRLREPGTRQNWRVKSDAYATFRKAIDPDVEKNLLAIPRKQRAMIRKGLKLGLRSEIDCDPYRVYRIYAESVRNLGTPVFARRYFLALKSTFGQDCEFLVVTHAGRPVAGVMSFYFRNEVLPYYGGGIPDARRLAANDFMYWEVMRRACQRGYRLFDFGRSKRGTGSFDFKTFWGFTAEPLHHTYFMLRGSELPNLNPLNPKFRILVALWKRLPLPVANFVGPHVVRSLG